MTEEWREEFVEVPIEEPPLGERLDKDKSYTNGHAPAAKPFAFWRIADMRELTAPDYIVDKLIPARGQSCIFAPSGHYKTMTALDLILAIAYNLEFHGFKVKSCPIVYVANEDAYNLARQRLLGLLDYHDLHDERIIVIPGDVSLADPEVVPRLLATATAAFPLEKPGFVFDTWDKSLGADPDRTCEVLPAVERADELIKGGAPFVLTLSHSPWSNPERTKGSVSYWASQQARIKVERDEVTGHGKLDLVHQKNGPSGLHLEFEYLQHEFMVKGEASTCLVPRRIHDAPERTPPKVAQSASNAGKGVNQSILIRELKKLASRKGNEEGVEVDKLQSSFIQTLAAHREQKGLPPLEPARGRATFKETLTSLLEANLVAEAAGNMLVPVK